MVKVLVDELPVKLTVALFLIINVPIAPLEPPKERAIVPVWEPELLEISAPSIMKMSFAEGVKPVTPTPPTPVEDHTLLPFIACAVGEPPT